MEEVKWNSVAVEEGWSDGGAGNQDSATLPELRAGGLPGNHVAKPRTLVDPPALKHDNSVSLSRTARNGIVEYALSRRQVN